MFPEFDSFGHKFKILLQKTSSPFIVKANTRYNLETRRTRPWNSNTKKFKISEIQYPHSNIISVKEQWIDGSWFLTKIVSQKPTKIEVLLIMW